MVTTARNKWGTEYPYLVCSGRTRRVTDCQRQAMPIQLIEELIEDEYRTIALSPQLRDDIEQLVLEDFDNLQAAATGERQQMERQRIELTAQRQKLLEAHYAGAIPLDLPKTEQDRIAGQLMRIQEGLSEAEANYEQARATLADTLDLTPDCHAAYLAASDDTRRLFNQAFFAKIYIDEDDETRERAVRVDYNEPFDNLLSRLVPARVHHELAQEETAHEVHSVGGSGGCTPRIAEGQSSHTSTLVEVSGLEPPTSTLRT
jgi:site-specific DNA recombinase